jgi:hypothetical protein
MVTVASRHRRFLRRYSRLKIGMPNSFECLGGFHQAIVAIGDFDGELIVGSAEERHAQPPRADSRWPRHCENCFYKFSPGDRWHFFTTSLALIPRIIVPRARSKSKLSDLDPNCDRCKRDIKDFRQPDAGGMTAGYYYRWFDFTDPGEEVVCDECMWADPRYIAVYGKMGS